MSTYANAHAKVKKWIFNVELPRNWFEFGIILKLYNLSYSDSRFIRWFKNPKIPGIQPIYDRM